MPKVMIDSRINFKRLLFVFSWITGAKFAVGILFKLNPQCTQKLAVSFTSLPQLEQYLIIHLHKDYYLSSAHKRQIPETTLTNMSVHIFIAVLMGRLPCSDLKIDTVIGMHHASGISIHPCAMQPRIRKIFITVLIVSSSPDCTTVGLTDSALRPHFTQTAASSNISAPQCTQYFIFDLSWSSF